MIVIHRSIMSKKLRKLRDKLLTTTAILEGQIEALNDRIGEFERDDEAWGNNMEDKVILLTEQVDLLRQRLDAMVDIMRATPTPIVVKDYNDEPPAVLTVTHEQMTLPDQRIPTQQVLDILSLVGYYVPEKVIDEWSAGDRQWVTDWAAQEHMAASGNPRPKKRLGRPTFIEKWGHH